MMSHCLSRPCTLLHLSHLDSCLPISGNADKLLPWWPRVCCLSSYEIVTSSSIPRVGCLAKGNEVVDVAISSQMRHRLGRKILLKVHGLGCLYPHCLTTLLFVPTSGIRGSRWQCGFWMWLVVWQGILVGQGRVRWRWIVGRSYHVSCKWWNEHYSHALWDRVKCSTILCVIYFNQVKKTVLPFYQIIITLENPLLAIYRKCMSTHTKVLICISALDSPKYWNLKHCALKTLDELSLLCEIVNLYQKLDNCLPLQQGS